VKIAFVDQADKQTNKQRRKQCDRQTNTTYQMKLSCHEISDGKRNTLPSAHIKSVNGQRPTHRNTELKFWLKFKYCIKQM